MTKVSWIQGETVYDDREIINKLYGSGFHLTDDLLPFYHMASYLNKYKNLSQKARQRIKWFDYDSEYNNISLTYRHFDISRKTFPKWKNRYNPNNLFTLEDCDQTLITKRQRDITPKQTLRINC